MTGELEHLELQDPLPKVSLCLAPLWKWPGGWTQLGLTFLAWWFYDSWASYRMSAFLQSEVLREPGSV